MQPMPGYGGGGYGGGGYGGPPHGPPAHGGAAPPTYEFSPAENVTIESVARYARLWGIISLISGVLLLIMGIGLAIAAGAVAAASAASHSSSSSGSNPLANSAAVGALGVALIPSALVGFIGGIFYLKSGSALKSVVDTQGDDIRLLTDAVRSLSTAFKIEAIAMAVSFVIGLVIGVVTRSGGQ